MLETIISTIGAVLVALISWAAKKTSDKGAAMEALWVAVQLTNAELVDDLKKKAEDGKLTAEEAKAARDLALSKAFEIAKGPALKVLQDWGKPKLEALVHDLVEKVKGKKEG